MIKDALSLEMAQSVPVAQVPGLQNDCVGRKLSGAGQQGAAYREAVWPDRELLLAIKEIEMKKTIAITEEDVQKALQKFLNNGGLIKHLPDEITPRNILVGAKFGMFEPVIETSGAGSQSNA